MVEVSEELLKSLIKNQTEPTKPKLVIKRLDLIKTDKEGLRKGTRANGTSYAVREYRGDWIFPEIWDKFMKQLHTAKSKITFEALINLGARINEVRHIEERDIDFERNTLTLRITKTKAKKGEKIGKPRTIPISSAFAKRLKKHFKTKMPGSKIGILSTAGANISLKEGLKAVGIKNYWMYSVHNIRKSHGNYLKVLGNLKIMNVDAMEICLRLGHDYNTFLKDYGSSSVMSSEDVQIAKQMFGDLYE